jgi:hypothetical protein
MTLARPLRVWWLLEDGRYSSSGRCCRWVLDAGLVAAKKRSHGGAAAPLKGRAGLGCARALGRRPPGHGQIGQALGNLWTNPRQTLGNPQATPGADLGQAIGVWRRQRGCISAQVLPANCERRRKGLEASCKARCSGVASRHPANGALPVAYIDELRRQLIASRVCFE